MTQSWTYEQFLDGWEVLYRDKAGRVSSFQVAGKYRSGVDTVFVENCYSLTTEFGREPLFLSYSFNPDIIIKTY